MTETASRAGQLRAASRRDTPVAPVVPSRGALRPLGIGEVELLPGFWADRQEVNRAATLRHCHDWMSRLGWIGNFDRVAAGGEAGHRGREFSDSEVYKLMEALAWETARTGDDWAEETFADLARRVVAAQQPDGYLNTMFGSPGRPPRYSDLEWGHELYCAGHLIQAAVARLRTHGEDELTAAARRLADHVCAVFGPDGIQGVCGHPEIETALAELGRATGEPRYAEQARLFVERRGHGTLGPIEFGPAYFQDEVPVRDATVLRGHAVRALYLAAGAVDVAVESGDDGLLEALRTQWANTVARRTYLTGGMGSRHEGEAFGDDFELPSDRAYAETCAGVASIMLSWRLLLADGDPRYADLIERTLYNLVAASPDERGTAFFYVNPLKRSEPGDPPALDAPSPRAASSLRAPWFEVSCCPGNVARTLAGLAAYVATVSDEGLQLHQHTPMRVDTSLPDGERVALTVRTGYPLAGRVVVTVESSATREWTLSLRVPPWARGRASLSVDGRRTTVHAATAEVTRRFSPGDTVVLELPLEPRLTTADSRIDALRASVAVELGPLVLCAESPGLPASARLDRIGVPAGAVPARAGADEVELPVLLAGAAEERPWPYGAHDAEAVRPASLRLIPYHRWAERGPSSMRVWLPRAGV